MKNYLLNFKTRLINLLPLLLSLLLGILLGWLAGSSWTNSNGEFQKVYEIRQGGYRLTNPLLDCEFASGMVEDNELRPFRHKVHELVDREIESKRALHISVYFRDLNNGPWFGINEKEEFSPASLLKVPIMIAYLKLAESNPQMLTKRLKYEKASNYNAMENIRPSKSIEAGKSYTIDELIYRMIVYSDNDAKDLLLRNMDMRDFEVPFRDLGIEIPGIRKSEDFMSVKTYASFFRILYNASYLNRKMSEKALEYLAMVEFKEGLVAGVPSNIPVAHKFGERRIINDDDHTDVKQLHDCAIIYYPDHPYLLCVMTRGYDFIALGDDIRDISNLVYREVDSQYRK